MKTVPYPSHTTLVHLNKLLIGARILNPSEASVEFTLGMVGEMMGQSDQARHYFEQALLKDANFSLALLNIGNHHFKRNSYAVAADFYERTIVSMRPNDYNLLQAHCNLGQTQRERGLLNSALESFNKVYEIIHANRLNECQVPISSSGELFAVSNLVTVQTMLCRWQHLELREHLMIEYLHSLSRKRLDIRALRGQDQYGVPLTTAVDPYTISLLRYGTHDADLTASRTVCVTLPSTFNVSDLRVIAGSGSPLRVGYLSVDWRNHPMGRLTARLVTSHNVSRVQAECFSYGPNDGSSVRQHVQSRAGRFHDLEKVRSPLDAAQRVSTESLDILVDLTTHTCSGRLEIAALKPAPIVIGYLGYAGSSGCAGFDYALADQVVAPPEQAHLAFSERVAYLPHSYQTNDMPMEIEPCTKGRAACRLERRLISVSSLPLHLQDGYDEARYYAESTQWVCSFNANKKMEPVSFAVWMSVLARVPSAVLVLLDVTPDTKVEIVQAAAYHGVSARRVLFAEKQAWYAHLHRSAACDLVLDTFVYGSHTTASDMLWMHVPVLTLASFGADRMPSRVAGSLIQSLRTPSAEFSSFAEEQWHSDIIGLLVVSTVKMYEETAVRLLLHISGVTALHDALGHRIMRSPTFDARTRQSEIESMYQTVFEVVQLTRDLKLSSLPHIVQLPSASSDDKAASSMRSEGEQSFLRQIALLKGDSRGEIDSRVRKISDLDFSVALKQLVGCLGPETLSLQSWGGVVAVSARLLTGVPSRVRETEWLQTLIRNVTISSTIVVEENGIESTSVQPVAHAAFLSQSALSAESLQADIRAIHTSTVDNSDHQKSELGSLLRRYLEMDGPAALAIFVHALQSLSVEVGDCGVAQSLVDVIRPLLFSVTTYPDVLARRRSQDSEVSDILTMHSEVVTATHDATSSLEMAAIAFTVDWASLDEQKIEVLLANVFLSKLLPTRRQQLFDQVQYSFMPLDSTLNVDTLATLLVTHAVCLNQARLSSDLVGLQYVMTTLSTLRLRSSSIEQLSNAGVALMDLGCSEIGHLMASVASLKLHQRRFVPFVESIETATVRTVAIFCEEYGQSWWPGWGPSAIAEPGRGMGGSEEAVFYLAMELARLGYEVVIFADIPQTDVGVVSHQQGGGTGSVRWLHCSNFDVRVAHDVFIAWRYSASLLVGAASKMSYLWLHDLVSGQILPPSLFSVCRGMLVQSEFHKQYMTDTFVSSHIDTFTTTEMNTQLRELLLTNIFVTPNGVVSSEMEASFLPKNDNNVFVFGSAPNRGLDLVLQSWAAIKAQLPHATLEVYYGFTAAVEGHMRSALGAHGYRLWVDNMHVMLKQDGVRYYGAVDHARLTEAYQRAGFLLYPTTFQETGCITALRAMAGGAIPVTSRLKESVLFALTRGFDLGPDQHLDLRTASDHEKLHTWLREEWVEAVVRASRMDADKLTALRERMVAAIRQRSTWRNTAEGLDALFRQHLAL
eukprot:gene23135-29328_t